MKTKTILHFFITLFILLESLLSIPVSAQLNADNLVQYGETDGLPSADVSKIITDQFGFVWIGTINGLTRYDGYEFKRFYFNPNDTASIHGLQVQSLYEDHQGLLWIGAGPSYLNAYNPATGKFRQYGFMHLIKHEVDVEVNINAICEDNNGRIYFGADTYRSETITGALLYKNAHEDIIRSFINPDSLPVQNVYRIIKDKSGNIYFLAHNGMFKIDTTGKLHRMEPPVETSAFKREEHPTDIHIDEEGYLWVMTCRARLWRINLQTNNPNIFAPVEATSEQGYYNNFLFDKNSNIWMGTNKGLLRYNRNSAQFEYFKTGSKKHLDQSAIADLQFDSFGTLWIGTLGQGVLKYEEKAVFKSYSYNKEDANSLSAGWANTIYEASDGRIWVATPGAPNAPGGLNVFDLERNTIKKYKYQDISPDTWIIDGILETEPGVLLINTFRGNWKFSTQTGTAQKINLNGLADTIGINNFYKDSKGNFWACTIKGVFKRGNDEDVFRRYDLSLLPGCDVISNEVTKALESPLHGLWVSTNNGLFLYNYSTDKFERHGLDRKSGDIFLTQDINSFYEDEKGMLWVGTWQGGLSVYNPDTKKIKTYTQNDGLPSMSVQGILADQKNNALWLSTFDGLSRLDLSTQQFSNYSVVDGIQSQLFADGGFARTKAGLFIFGGSNGITVFDPNEINKRSSPPRVFLTDLKLFNKSVVPGESSVLKKPIYETKEITLDYNQNNTSLEFLAIHYSNPSKNRYAYKMENYDIEWREVGSQHFAFYTNLPPGKYTFHVKAANNNGVWNEVGAILNITINPPWWKTVWAYILYGLLFIVAAALVNRYLRHQLIEREREKNREKEIQQAKEIEKAYSNLKLTQAQLVQSEKMASLGELTAGIAHEIQNPLNFVNNFSELNKELLDEMKVELSKGNMADANALADNVIENSEKINQHGRRADSIVKGMLQHSQSTVGKMEPTDINVLADEYLRLAYHGLRAKDKLFNATLQTDFDESIGKIKIIPQDMGRVLLNLYNNAFYAIGEKCVSENNEQKFKPTVIVTTKKLGGKVIVSVKDNGNGIPQKIVEKIFQPFFTTKPTGLGTGLGLSLSYDIVKAHGGEINVVSKEGEGTEFLISLNA